MKEENKKAIIFDLFGTLLVYGNMKKAWSNWEKTCYKFWCDYGYKGNINDFCSLNNHFFSTMSNVSLDKQLNLYEFALHEKAKLAGVKIPKGKIRELADVSCKNWQTEIYVDKQAFEILSVLKKKYRLALLTNYDHSPHIRSVLKDYKLEQYFDEIIISGDVDLKKPQKEIFELMCEKLNLACNQCVYVGDDPEKDCVGSSSVGMQAVLLRKGKGIDRLEVDYKSDLENGLADNINHDLNDNVYVINNLIDLLNIFK